jgi:hypothetical protein
MDEQVQQEATNQETANQEETAVVQEEAVATQEVTQEETATQEVQGEAETQEVTVPLILTSFNNTVVEPDPSIINSTEAENNDATPENQNSDVVGSPDRKRPKID